MYRRLFAGQTCVVVLACAAWIAFVCAVAPAHAQQSSTVNAGTDSDRIPTAPPEKDEFSFVVFGDRTGGPQSGMMILEEAVRMANRLGPAFVLNVGDMVPGYNVAPLWIADTLEYRSYMDKLDMPWYPVAGNHDVYARPRLPGGHTKLYKKHVAPLYYSFDYKWAHFVILFSDEKLSFADPAVNQNMGVEQMTWLREDLAATDATHVFVFLHHPRWTYKGCNWNDVHRILADSGKTVTVIAGHIHNYRDDGVFDGVHYYAIATTGGELQEFRETASIHHICLVRVRRDGYAMAVLPVGSVLASDMVLGRELDEMEAIHSAGWLSVSGNVQVDMDQSRSSMLTISLANPSRRSMTFAVKLTVPPDWNSAQKLLEGEIKAGGTIVRGIRLDAPALRLFGAPDVIVDATLQYELASGLVQPIRATQRLGVPVSGLERLARADAENNKVLVLDGKSAVRVDLGKAADDLDAFTLECWVKGDRPAGRTALLTKTESSAFGIFWAEESSGHTLPNGYVHLRGHGYVGAAAGAAWDWGRWTHVALCYDGEMLRLFVNGRLSGQGAGAGAITPNKHPLYVGADPNRHGDAVSFFTGAIDEVRLSSIARYDKPFQPTRFFDRDGDTLLLLHFDSDVGVVFPDDSGSDHHGWAVGSPKIQSQTR